jgi:cyclophilin family peptidyl-prolyl cis-trans isomerase
VSALLGWILALTVPAAASLGPAEAAPDRLPLLETTLSGCPLDPARGDPEALDGSKGNQPGQATGTKPVQAPPLQAPVPTPSPGNPVAVIATSLGDITVELFKDLAPVSVENFLRYANDGFFDETIFHRVKPRFMIQGGGFTATLTEKQTRPPIQNEATNGLRNTRGTLAMARRASLRSATSQFYINIADNRMLDHAGYSPDEFGYAVFGRVLSGMDVADRIAAVPTRTTVDMEDVPIEPVIIKNVRVVK